MAELQVLLQSNGAFKSELLQAFLSASRGSTGAGPLTHGTTGANTTTSTTSLSNRDDNSNINSNIISRNLNGNTVFNNSNTTNANQTTPLILDNNGASPVTTSNTTTTATTGATPININLNNNPAANQMDNLNMNKPESDTTSTTSDIFANLPSNKDFVDFVLNEVKQEGTPTRDQLTAQVSQAAVEAHMTTTINTYANVAEANERIKNQAAPPSMPDMSKLTINPSAMWQKFQNSMKPEIAKVVNFCKKLPGFCEIAENDRTMMIKQGTFEVMIARFCILIDIEKEEMLDPMLKMKSPRHVVKSLPTGKFVDKFFDVAKSFNPLELTDGEIGVFTAILMFCPDRSGIADSSSIATIQLLYLQTLYGLLQESHQDADQVFTKLISLIPMFQAINAEHFRFINAMKAKLPTEYNSQFPPLHKDVFVESSATPTSS